MKKILDELWYGKINPADDYRENGKEAKQLLEYASKHHDKLNFELNDEQKAIFEKFNECCYELNDITERSIFSYAFKLGAKMAIEIMSLEQ